MLPRYLSPKLGQRAIDAIYRKQVVDKMEEMLY